MPWHVWANTAALLGAAKAGVAAASFETNTGWAGQHELFNWSVALSALFEFEAETLTRASM